MVVNVECYAWKRVFVYSFQQAIQIISQHSLFIENVCQTIKIQTMHLLFCHTHKCYQVGTILSYKQLGNCGIGPIHTELK